MFRACLLAGVMPLTSQRTSCEDKDGPASDQTITSTVPLLAAPRAEKVETWYFNEHLAALDHHPEQIQRHY